MAWLARELQIFSKWVIQIFSEKMVIAPMPKLSVIVPVYNTEKYLRECIDSILAQTFTDFELILVDDGSTDKSGAICDEYCRLDDRIRVIHQNNGGVTVARKRGVELSSGEYVTFVDSDDWINRDMYRIMLEQGAADILICDMVYFSNYHKYEIPSCVDPGYYDKQKMNERFYSNMLFDYTCGCPAISPSFCNKLIRSEILRNVINDVDDSITYGEDALCTYACMLDAESIQIIDSTLYYYRENPTSICNTYSDKMFSKMILLGTELNRFLKKRNFNAAHQLYGYLAQHSLECIRYELLFHVGAIYWEKRKRILDYLKSPLIAQSFHYAIPHIRKQKSKLKMWLCINNMIGLLNVLHIGSHVLMRRQKHDN